MAKPAKAASYYIEPSRRNPPTALASRRAYWIVDSAGKRVARAYGYDKAREKLRYLLGKVE